MTKRILIAVFSFAFILFVFWLGGGNFVRGYALAYWVVLATIVGFLAYLYFGWVE